MNAEFFFFFHQFFDRNFFSRIFSQNSVENVTPTIQKTIEENPPVDRNDSIEKAFTELLLTEQVTITTPKMDIESKQQINVNSNSAAESLTSMTVAVGCPVSAVPASVPPSSANIEHFFKEVQRYEKIVNGLATKTLNGTTPLQIKWKNLHDLLEKDIDKRTVSVSKLFPEKNRNMLSVPYDHARVLLPTETDNYINAAHIRVS